MRTLKGREYETETGLRFQIVSDQFFPAGEHDKANGAYLDTLREGLLVSASYHGTPVPLVTVRGGVVKLNEVKAAGVPVKGAYGSAPSLVSRRPADR